MPLDRTHQITGPSDQRFDCRDVNPNATGRLLARSRTLQKQPTISSRGMKPSRSVAAVFGAPGSRNDQLGVTSVKLSQRWRQA